MILIYSWWDGHQGWANVGGQVYQAWPIRLQCSVVCGDESQFSTTIPTAPLSGMVFREERERNGGD